MTADDLAQIWPGGAVKRGETYHAHCPAHDDQRESLTFQDGRGLVLIKCHAGGGCSFSAILDGLNRALGLSLSPGDLRHGGNGHRRAGPARRIVAVYPYHDETGRLLSEAVRFDPKGFSQRRPDGNDNYVWNLDGVRRVCYRLPELRERLAGRRESERVVYIAEGEKDVDRLWTLGLAATTNAMGAKKWQDDHTAQLIAAGAARVVILPDRDADGEAHGDLVAGSCRSAGLPACIVRLPGLPEKGDVSEYLDAGHGLGELLAEVATSGVAGPVPGGRSQEVTVPPGRGANPWAQAMPAPDFLGTTDEERETLEPRLLAAGSITECFSPRGLGKTHVAHALAVKHAKAGRRVLFLDRDNSRREVRRRLKAWGASVTPSLHVLTRDQVPPLTDRTMWQAFPFSSYDLVVIDSLDASTEGVGEKDSAKPSQAFAPLLDIAHRENGPAILVLGNTIKSAEHSRGSGIVEDRADVVYEVRDATDLRPTGTKPWWLELPAAGVGAWAERAARRKRRETYRLAFVPSKYRIGEEPEPFILELDLTGELWQLRDVSAEVVAAGEVARTDAEHTRVQQRQAAAAALREEVGRRAGADAPMLSRTDAEPFLLERGLSRKAAREVIADGEGRDWQTVIREAERGRPKALLPVSHDRPGQNSRGSESPHGERAGAASVLAEHAASGRPELALSPAAPDAAIMRPRDFGRLLTEQAPSVPADASEEL
jgi:hypothetical protein